jgi:hypothetical protein
MREVELKCVAPEPDAVGAALLAAGAELTFSGHLADRRYDTSPRSLLARDFVLRLRLYTGAGGSRACLDGTPATIEAAIAATGLPRDGFTAERLPDFVRRFELRTGQRAALCERELTGDYRFSADDA